MLGQATYKYYLFNVVSKLYIKILFLFYCSISKSYFEESKYVKILIEMANIIASS